MNHPSKPSVQPTISDHPVMVIAFGSRGDNTPLLALAQELLSDGVNIVFVTTNDFVETIKEGGITNYRVIPLSIRELLIELPDLLKQTKQIFKFMGTLGDFLNPRLEVTIRTVAQAIEEFRPIVAITSASGDLMLRQTIAHYHIPQYRVDPHVWAEPSLGRLGMFPILIPDKFPSWPPRWLYAGAVHRVFEFMMWLGVGTRSLKATRHVLGEKVHKVGYARGRRQDRLRIYGISPQLIFGRQPKLPARIHMPGYFFTRPPEVPIPAEVVEFARGHKAEHRPVIGVCFGSMVLNPSETTQIVVEAVRELNIAALLIGGWGELIADSNLWKPGNDIYYVPQIDFASILPELDGFITHGGSGSTAHILRAGLPYIGVIFVPDQINWIILGQKKGVSPKPISRTELTKDGLKGAILDMLSAPKRDAARKLASQIELDGVRKAANLILSDLPRIPSA